MEMRLYLHSSFSGNFILKSNFPTVPLHEVNYVLIYSLQELVLQKYRPQIMDQQDVKCSHLEGENENKIPVSFSFLNYYELITSTPSRLWSYLEVQYVNIHWSILYRKV